MLQPARQSCNSSSQLCGRHLRPAEPTPLAALLGCVRKQYCRVPTLRQPEFDLIIRRGPRGSLHLAPFSACGKLGLPGTGDCLDSVVVGNYVDDSTVAHGQKLPWLHLTAVLIGCLVPGHHQSGQNRLITQYDDLGNPSSHSRVPAAPVPGQTERPTGSGKRSGFAGKRFGKYSGRRQAALADPSLQSNRRATGDSRDHRPVVADLGLRPGRRCGCPRKSPKSTSTPTTGHRVEPRSNVRPVMGKLCFGSSVHSGGEQTAQRDEHPGGQVPERDGR
jgi:hypothetical protein